MWDDRLNIYKKVCDFFIDITLSSLLFYLSSTEKALTPKVQGHFSYRKDSDYSAFSGRITTLIRLPSAKIFLAKA